MRSSKPPTTYSDLNAKAIQHFKSMREENTRYSKMHSKSKYSVPANKGKWRKTVVGMAIEISQNTNSSLKKLNLTDSSIEKVGEGHPEADYFKTVESIFISRNNLNNLDGIDQFVNLKSISVANNNISVLEDIKCLKNCSNLETVFLLHNPICNIPNYRSNVIHLLSQIKNLDSLEVSQKEKEQAPMVAKKEDRYMKMLLANQALLHLLEKAKMKLDTHYELQKKVFSNIRVWNSPNLPELSLFDTKKLINIISTHFLPDREDLTSFLLDSLVKIRKQLTYGKTTVHSNSEAMTLHSKNKEALELSESWEAAFSEMGKIQQSALVDYLAQIDVHSQRIAELKDRIEAKDPHSIISTAQEKALLPIERENLIHEMRQEILGLQKSAGNNSESTTFSKSLADNNSNDQSPSKTMKKQPQELSSSERKYVQRLKSNKINHALSSTGTLSDRLPPQQEEPSQTSRFGNSSVQKRSAPQRNNLRNQVEKLKTELDQRKNNEELLRDVNKQLRERLELYQQKNKENVELAESEIRSMQNELEEEKKSTNKIRRKMESLEEEKANLEVMLGETKNSMSESISTAISNLEKEIEDKQKELNDSKKQCDEYKTEIEELQNHSEYLASRATQYSEELKKFVLQEKQANEAEYFYENNLKKWFFYLLKQNHYNYYHLYHREKYFIERKSNIQSKQILDAWKKFIIIEAKHRKNSVSNIYQAAEICLQNWKHYVNIEQQVRYLAVQNQCAKGRSILSSWLSYVHSQQEWREMEYLASFRNRESILFKFFWKWKQELENVRQKEYTENLYINSMAEHREYTIKQNALVAWKNYISLMQYQRESAKTFQISREWNIMSKSIEMWKRRFHSRVLFYDNIYKADKHFRERIFSIWSNKCKSKREDRKKLRKCKSYHHKAIAKSYIRQWRQYHRANVIAREKNARALRFYFSNVANKTLYAWKKFTKKHVSRKRNIKRSILHCFKEFSERNKKKRILLEEKEQFNQRLQHDSRHKIFGIWREKLKEKMRLQSMEYKMKEKSTLIYLRRYLTEWSRITFTSKIDRLVSVSNELESLKAKMEEQSASNTSTELQNLKLVNKLQEMSKQITDYKAELEEKEKQIKNLEETKEEESLTENGLRNEIERLKNVNTENEHEIKALKEQIVSGQPDEAELITQQKLEIEKLEEKVNNLTNEVQEKDSALGTLKKAMTETRSQLDGNTEESEHKLNSALQIAWGLRDTVESQESKISELESLNDKQRIEIKEWRSKCALLERQLESTKSQKETEISSLKGKLSEVSNHVHGAQDQLEQYKTQLGEKEDLIQEFKKEIAANAEVSSGRSPAPHRKTGLTSPTASRPGYSSPHPQREMNQSTSGPIHSDDQEERDSDIKKIMDDKTNLLRRQEQLRKEHEQFEEQRHKLESAFSKRQTSKIETPPRYYQNWNSSAQNNQGTTSSNQTLQQNTQQREREPDRNQQDPTNLDTNIEQLQQRIFNKLNGS